jgi:hypothetical protein
MSRLKPFLSWCAVVIIGLSLISVLGTYVVSNFQPFRGPSKAYFWIFLFASLLSSRLAIWLIIFSLPLMPSFHLQLEFITHPAVKYFFSYSAADAVVGLFLGLQLKHYFVKRKFISVVDLPPWPFGLLLLILTCSTALAVSRNIWQSASTFLFSDLIQNVFNYKLINSKSDYLPIADLIIFGLGVLLAMIISRELKNTDDKTQIVFKPLVISLLVSAIWGIFQSLTGFGLEANTTTIRLDFFGYGALGFQPDIHAFAGLMIIGAVGLTGFLKTIDYKFWRILTITTSVLCWVAIVLSKSRASLGLTIMMAIVLALLSLRHVQKARLPIYGLLAAILLALLIYITKSALAAQLYETYLNDRTSFFEVLNILSSWRLDLHAAALRMWSHYPIMGIGQGNFYRVSSIYEFSGSALMARLGGENAHNYFLQILTEVGILGIFCFILILFLPIFKTQNFNKLKSIYILIIALFLGNIYSHSLLIRENYYLFLVFIGVLYACPIKNLSHFENTKFNFLRLNNNYIFILIIFSLIVVYGWIEIKNGYRTVPYNYGSECYRESSSNVSGWNGGRYKIYLPENARGVKIVASKVNDYDYDYEDDQFSMYIDLFDNLKNNIIKRYYINRKIGNLQIEIKLLESEKIGMDGGVAILYLSNCTNASEYKQKNSYRKIPLKIKDVIIF